jgi:YidC/Oxa1 family membrane protein insertase
MTRRKASEAINALKRQFGGHAGFVLEEDMAQGDSFFDSDLMISDWSGAALEYAFATERPVLFVDVPRKINNPDYEAIGVTPIEVSIRTSIGEVIAPQRLKELPRVAERLSQDPEAFAAKIRELRGRTVYHPGRSAQVAAETIAEQADAAKIG